MWIYLFQRKLSELETLLMRGLNKPSKNIPNTTSTDSESIPSDKQQNTEENGRTFLV